ncbi:hypothetical protein F2Q68_00015951 [Brassica cretica]|uniref:Serine/threonine specific protein phosphatases domain-containing protein n=1 Tax=Brassica cretica TaxID=69181 RepID=A0A8S9H9S0_BRACR|nr:hypothetical protein F2Q68_00015951 [Brassica cretica]
MADLNLWQFPPPPYATSTTQTLFNPQEDLPGPRCGHTLTAVYHRLIVFGGVTSVPSGGSDNSLQCLTNSVYCLNSLTKKWTRVYPEGEPPSPRTNHAAVSCGDGVLIQGGIGPSGICNGDLHVLDMSSDTFKWKKVVVQEGMAPCPRYGHVMGLAGKTLVIFGGKKEGNLVLADTWALNTTRHPNVWEILYPYGDLPCGRVYASATTRDRRYFMLYGGRDQHGMVFVNLRLHVFGGALSNTRLVDAEEAVSVLDTSTGVWVDTSNEVMRRSLHAAASVGSRIYVYGGIREGNYFDTSKEVMRRSLHAAASVGSRIYVYGGIREGVLLDDLLISGELLSSGPTVPSFLWSLLGRSPNTPWPPASDMNDGYKPNFSKEKLHDLVNKVISTLLRPQTWEPPVDRKFFLSFHELAELCFAAKQIIEQEPTVLQLYAPIKVFGDPHGQFGDLMRLFYEYGYPSRQGDISSDPTAHDSILGIGVNERGPHVVSFGPDRVNAFCERNDIDMIIRGHECVLDGFERFAQGKLITVFSATNYCGKFKNAVAILVIGRNLDVVPKLIHPLPPPISPSENVPDKAWIEVDRERPPTPIRGQRKPDFEQGSTS